MSALVVPADVGVCVIADVVYVAPLPDGPILVLDGVAAVIWREATSSAPGDVADRVAATTGASRDAVDEPVTAFVSDLIARGLLAHPRN